MYEDPLKRIICDTLIGHGINQYKTDEEIRDILHDIIDRANKEGIRVTFKGQDRLDNAGRGEEARVYCTCVKSEGDARHAIQKTSQVPS